MLEVYLKPIEVVVSFTKDGKISPVRFRIINETSEYETVFIKTVTRRRQEKVGKNFIDIYTCTGVIDYSEKMFELKFENNSGEWTLYRM
ncbi:MAG: hypothetical protein QMB63_08500 [Clostridiaceae bacterium]